MTETTSTTTHQPRPSHRLPKPIFNALLDLEDQVRKAAMANHELDAKGYLEACARVGGTRDQLAQILLDAGVTR